MKKERWSELEILDLPSGELDYFERKSGALFSDEKKLRTTLGKALSAFANSGGGNIVLGVDDTGRIDGVPCVYRGRQRTREWLERVLPHLVVAPLQDFRVHEAEPDQPSQIPSDSVVIVIDVGDSQFAPHQDIETKHYFHRVGSNSEPAPHHVLEMLRGRERYPTQKVAHAWLNFVISPFLTRLGREEFDLNSLRLHWERNTGRFQGIDSFYISDGALSANQMQFLESYPGIKQQLEIHDQHFREFSYQVSSLSRTIVGNSAFRQAYLVSISPASLHRINPSLSDQIVFNQDAVTLRGLFSDMSEAQRLALIAQHVINNEHDLTDDIRPFPLWNLFKDDFLAVLEEPNVREKYASLFQSVTKFLRIVRALLSMLENTRRELAIRHGEVWEDETLRLTAFPQV